MIPEVFYVLESGPRKGESRPAVITRRYNENSAAIAVFVDGDFDGFGSPVVWRSSVQFNEFGAPGTMHIAGPGCVTFRDHPHSNGEIEVDRTDPLNPRFKYVEKLVVAEMSVKTASPEQLFYLSPVANIGIEIAKRAERLLDVVPENRNAETEKFVDEIQVEYGVDGKALFYGLIKDRLIEYWNEKDKLLSETPFLLRPRGEPLIDSSTIKTNDKFNTAPLTEKPTEEQAVTEETTMSNIAPIDLRPKQLISDDKLKEIFGGESDDPESHPDSSHTAVNESPSTATEGQSSDVS
jgi:hypothetical protein